MTNKALITVHSNPEFDKKERLKQPIQDKIKSFNGELYSLPSQGDNPIYGLSNLDPIVLEEEEKYREPGRLKKNHASELTKKHEKIWVSGCYSKYCVDTCIESIHQQKKNNDENIEILLDPEISLSIYKENDIANEVLGDRKTLEESMNEEYSGEILPPQIRRGNAEINRI